MTGERKWPSLPLDAWEDTYATLHRWTQIVGKVRLARMPWINHSWHVVLYVTSRGLTTGPVPDGARTFTVDFDFIDQVLRIHASDGASRDLPLLSQSVAAFYARFMEALAQIGVQIAIHARPNELEDDTIDLVFTSPPFAL